MSDIAVTCPACQHTWSMSEYASRDDVHCPSCGAVVELSPDTVEKKGGLKLRQVDLAAPGSLIGESKDVLDHDPVGPAPGSAVGEASSLEEVYRKSEEVKPPSRWWGWAALLAMMLVLVGGQLVVADDTGLMSLYEIARLVLIGIVLLLVVLVAFEDSLFQGLPCLLFPPYALFYAAIRLESHLLRGLFFGLVLGLCAELYFIPEHALFPAIQRGIDHWIGSTQRSIERAGDAPTFE